MVCLFIYLFFILHAIKCFCDNDYFARYSDQNMVSVWFIQCILYGCFYGVYYSVIFVAVERNYYDNTLQFNSIQFNFI